MRIASRRTQNAERRTHKKQILPGGRGARPDVCCTHGSKQASAPERYLYGLRRARAYIHTYIHTYVFSNLFLCCLSERECWWLARGERCFASDSLADRRCTPRSAGIWRLRGDTVFWRRVSSVSFANFRSFQIGRLETRTWIPMRPPRLRRLRSERGAAWG